MTIKPSLKQAAKWNEEPYSSGYKTFEKAEQAMYDDISESLLTEQLCRIGAYWTILKGQTKEVKRFAIFEKVYFED